MTKKVLVGMSGGVDSSVTAHLLMEEGYEVEGVTMRLFTDADKDVQAVVDRLGIKHSFVDFKDFFVETIIKTFGSDYESGLTPNPCITCNKKVKFGAMYDYAMDQGFDYIATGHYARVEKKGQSFYLKKAQDRAKDQTYFLYNLTQEILGHVLFPLGEYSKPQIREIAKSLGFQNHEKKDSQDICFTGEGDYGEFLIDTCRLNPIPGDFIDREGNKIGDHKGLIYYTIGQRKGLGQTFGKPMYVMAKNHIDNTVVLGENRDLFEKEVYLKDINMISGQVVSEDMAVQAKIRYNQEAAQATLTPQGKLIFDQEQRAVAPGQSGVFYDGDLLIGGGVIALK